MDSNHPHTSRTLLCFVFLALQKYHTGTYIYTEASDKVQGQAAILKSGDFTATEKRCVEFYYHMNGEGVGNLYVQSQADTSTLVTTLKTLSGNKGDAWRQDMVRFGI